MASLPFTAAACKLGVAIYHARSEAYGIAILPWNELGASDRQTYVDEAALTLESVKPLAARKVVPLADFLIQTAVDAVAR